MKGFFAFTKKEFLEYLRNFKFMILLAVFLIFGMLSPLTAKMLPDIFSKIAVKGMTIHIPEPTYIDAYSQYFKNISQMGFIVFLLIFGGLLSQEISKGTLIMILSKGVSRHVIILSKYVVSLIFWTVSLCLSALTTYGYTVFLFKKTAVDHLVFSLFCLWLFGAFVLALILLASTLTTSSYGGLLLTVSGLAILLILNIPPRFQQYNPISLASDNVGFLTGAVHVNDRFTTVWLTIGFTVLILAGSLQIFKRKQL